jgi:RNA polymerase sigma-70 factor (family 1)
MAANFSGDIELWRQVKQGDRFAYDQLYHLYASPIFAMVYKHIPNRADAEDILQDVFIDLWDKRLDISIENSLFNYLYTMARNRTLRYIKKTAARPESLELLQQLMHEHEMPMVLQDVYSESEIRHIESKISNEVDELPEQMKKVYQLNQDSGMSISQIAELLLISPNTVKNHLSKVRKRLRHTVSKMATVFFTFL